MIFNQGERSKKMNDKKVTEEVIESLTELVEEAERMTTKVDEKLSRLEEISGHRVNVSNDIFLEYLRVIQAFSTINDTYIECLNDTLRKSSLGDTAEIVNLDMYRKTKQDLK